MKLLYNLYYYFEHTFFYLSGQTRIRKRKDFLLVSFILSLMLFLSLDRFKFLDHINFLISEDLFKDISCKGMSRGNKIPPTSILFIFLI